MQTDLDSLQQLLRTAYDAWYPSRQEAETVNNFYHNRQYTDEVRDKLINRGQPAETYNLLKVYGRPLLGYFGTVSTTFSVTGRQQEDQILAEVMKGVLDYTLEQNDFTNVSRYLKLDLMLSGLCCAYINPQIMRDDDGAEMKDQEGRPLTEIKIQHVPYDEIVPDHMSQELDFADARFVMRFRWVPKEYIRDNWPDKLDKLEPNMNATGLSAADFQQKYGSVATNWQENENYLVIHTCIRDDEGKSWSIFWSGDVELERKEVTYKAMKFPYLVYRMCKSNIQEYYGIFREIIETQKAVDQAVLKLNQLTAANKYLFETKAVKDRAAFEEAANTVLALLEVDDITKVRREDLTGQIQSFYAIIEKGEERVRKVLSINLSFLGSTFAHDSGRKVQLQQNATIISLRDIITVFESLYRAIGWSVIKLVKQYYQATQVIKIVDEDVGTQYLTLNQPFTYLHELPDGSVEERVKYEIVRDPASGKPMSDDNDMILMAPRSRVNTDVRLARVDLKVDTTDVGLEEERNAILTETLVNGPAGQLLAQLSPGDYLAIQSEAARAVSTKQGRRIAQRYAKVSEQLLAQQGQEGAGPGPAQGTTPPSNQPTLPGNY